MKLTLASGALAACCVAVAAGPPPVPHSFQPLEYVPRVAAASNFSLVADAGDNKSALYEIQLDDPSAQYAEPAIMAVLAGTPYEVGQAYGTCLLYTSPSPRDRG